MARWHQLNCELKDCYCKEFKVDELLSIDKEFTEEENMEIEQKWYKFL